MYTSNTTSTQSVCCVRDMTNHPYFIYIYNKQLAFIIKTNKLISHSVSYILFCFSPSLFLFQNCNWNEKEFQWIYSVATTRDDWQMQLSTE